ncbi:DEKNAAC104014 [Brettanomyces naardenensis]|uniref:DEKNAAC104014 n=1 Tax=Brettanomyces naardenensis TaxID=13370 RepID=A0A448YQC7_BRENA|nr:DEKNAAC104014 [Brettanomyces naardenensis]
MLDPNETQLYTTKVSILTIPRDEFWLFKSGVLQIIYRLADHYEGGGNGGLGGDSRYDTDLSASSDNEASANDGSAVNGNSLGGAIRDSTGGGSFSGSIDNSLTGSIDNSLQGYSDIEGIEVGDDGLFFHLAFTVEEVTLMCSSKIIKKYLGKTLKFCKEHLQEEKQPTLLEDKFLVLQVFSDGLNIGKKILELTEPLSLCGISLFFISNFFSDIVLVPVKEKQKVLEVLKGMEGEKMGQPKQMKVEENFSAPASPLTDLETTTFDLFKSKLIKPKLIGDVKLLLTGARSGDCANVLKRTAEALSRLNTGREDDTYDFPSYFAITRTSTGEIGLMLPQEDEELAKLNYDKSTIMGSLQDSYYPVFINLSNLPLDLKGIVAGVASKLLKSGLNEMSYLSFGKSGVVLIPDNYYDRVEEVLKE